MLYGKCHECANFGTMNCPTSSKCLAFDERPYFIQKQKKRRKNNFDVKIALIVLGVMIIIAISILAIILY